MQQSALFILAILACGVVGDMYLQTPRGSNDRLNENTADRQNANRLFDSQNNARGGYCWGPSMNFVEGSVLPIEWTAQHGCGGDHVTCTEIVQYMCSDTAGNPAEIIRDGTTTNTITNDGNAQAKNGNGEYVYGMNEDQAYYNDCNNRERNKGLFTADQNVGNAATNTRQNPNGANNRYGFECPEERDYYPYWHPSPWKDIAVKTDSLDHCAFYTAESQNVKAKNYCSGVTRNGNTLVPNNEAACLTAGGTWSTAAAHGIAAPDCSLAVYSRDNHLGNTAGDALTPQTANHTWTLPGADQEPCVATGTCACVLRVRYNITTNESSGVTDEFLDSTDNAAIKNNPTLAVEGGEVQLALNTAQYGRTFQDRSFTFSIGARPKGVSSDAKIYNLNVRGKRGNIVQTFPATEYDFVPNNLAVEEGDYVHFQWTGCDTNPAGNAGEGLAGTDRSNIVQIKNLDSNIPLISTTNETIDKPLFESSALRAHFALLGQTNCPPAKNLGNNDPTNCAKLNQVKTPYFDGGLVQMNTTGEYYYQSTRNNNFSNRTQKGKITILPSKKNKAAYGGVIAGLVIGSIAVVGAALGGTYWYGKKNPHTSVGQFVDNLPTVSLDRFRFASSSTTRQEPLLNTYRN